MANLAAMYREAQKKYEEAAKQSAAFDVLSMLPATDIGSVGEMFIALQADPQLWAVVGHLPLTAFCAALNPGVAAASNPVKSKPARSRNRLSRSQFTGLKAAVLGALAQRARHPTPAHHPMSVDDVVASLPSGTVARLEIPVGDVLKTKVSYVLGALARDKLVDAEVTANGRRYVAKRAST